jgi:hypothetical protein
MDRISAARHSHGVPHVQEGGELTLKGGYFLPENVPAARKDARHGGFDFRFVREHFRLGAVL